MTITHPHLTARLLSLAAVGLLAAACGSSSGSSASSASSTSASGAAAATGSGTAATAPAASAVTVKTTTGPLGTYLVDQAGRTLYLWDADKGSASTCASACTKYWPPLTGAAKAGSGVQQSSLGSGARPGGGTQVTYDGHPLYYFAGDRTAGSTSGQGNNGFGATWWVVGKDGKAIRAAAGSASGSSSRSGY